MYGCESNSVDSCDNPGFMGNFAIFIWLLRFSNFNPLSFYFGLNNSWRIRVLWLNCICVDLYKNDRCYHAKNADSQADPKELLKILVLIVNDRSCIVIQSSHQFDHEKQHAECDGQLLWRKPETHDRLLHYCLWITDSEDQSTNNAMDIVLLLNAEDKDVLAKQSCEGKDQSYCSYSTFVDQLWHYKRNDHAANCPNRKE